MVEDLDPDNLLLPFKYWEMLAREVKMYMDAAFQALEDARQKAGKKIMSNLDIEPEIDTKAPSF